MAKNHYGKNSYNAQNADNCMDCHDTFQNSESDKTSPSFSFNTIIL